MARDSGLGSYLTKSLQQKGFGAAFRRAAGIFAINGGQNLLFFCSID